MLARILTFILVLACNLTDVSVGGVKVSELLVLLLMPLLFRNGFIIKKTTANFLLVFVFFLFTAILVSLRTTFYMPANEQSPLKDPYIISVARFFELCIGAIVYGAIGTGFGAKDGAVLKEKFFTYSAVFTSIILVIYLFDLLGGTDFVTEPNDIRLKGFFVEGGPYGLFCAAIICLCHSFGLLRASIILPIGVAFLLSQSKAGLLLLILYFGANAAFKIKNFKKFFATSAMAVLLAVVGWQFLGDRLQGYFEDTSAIELTLRERSDDPSVVMGRIAATYIAPNMIFANPVLGVGLGNYSLVRNDAAYRGIFPVVDDWDLTGLGAVTVLAENGILGLLLFCGAYLAVIRRMESRGMVIASLIPAACFILGLQIYFVYPWIILGLCYRLGHKNAYVAYRPRSKFAGV